MVYDVYGLGFSTTLAMSDHLPFSLVKGFDVGPGMIIWRFPKLGISPKSSIFMGFSLKNHPFQVAPIFRKLPFGPRDLLISGSKKTVLKRHQGILFNIGPFCWPRLVGVFQRLGLGNILQCAFDPDIERSLEVVTVPGLAL
jgi:hypothetical protein